MKWEREKTLLKLHMVLSILVVTIINNRQNEWERERRDKKIPKTKDSFLPMTSNREEIKCRPKKNHRKLITTTTKTTTMSTTNTLHCIGSYWIFLFFYFDTGHTVYLVNDEFWMSLDYLKLCRLFFVFFMCVSYPKSLRIVQDHSLRSLFVYDHQAAAAAVFFLLFLLLFHKQNNW